MIRRCTQGSVRRHTDLAEDLPSALQSIIEDEPLRKLATPDDLRPVLDGYRRIVLVAHDHAVELLGELSDQDGVVGRVLSLSAGSSPM